VGAAQNKAGGTGFTGLTTGQKYGASTRAYRRRNSPMTVEADNLARSISEADLETLEVDLLLQGVHRNYGYDFTGYAYSSLRRRIANVMRTEKVRTVSA